MSGEARGVLCLASHFFFWRVSGDHHELDSEESHVLERSHGLAGVYRL
jgi:hypothetical protein